MNAIVYDRVSTDGQAESGLSQDAQRAATENYCRFKGWTIIGSESDVVTSKKQRPGFERAIERCLAGEADVIIASKLSRISRSVVETINLLERSHREGWGLVALDIDIDTTTLNGRLFTTIVAAINEYERGMIAERTREALQAARERGVKLGRPQVYPYEARLYIATLAREKGFRGAARTLNQEGFPALGREWYPATVRKIAIPMYEIIDEAA